MNKKVYKEPKIKAHELKGEVLLAGSDPKPAVEGYSLYDEIDE